ncbi:hypothetical protein VNO78_03501 [Psophocarpus tetragonolobus]|uniref:Uncharacterized protein n=1 Tax=Psophocarpus tetragonolobus TaxID=3891 RepID=A0AAN9TE72_PSOTE
MLDLSVLQKVLLNGIGYGIYQCKAACGRVYFGAHYDVAFCTQALALNGAICVGWQVDKLNIRSGRKQSKDFAFGHIK